MIWFYKEKNIAKCLHLLISGGKWVGSGIRSLCWGSYLTSKCEGKWITENKFGLKKKKKTGRLICPSLPFRSLHQGETRTSTAEAAPLPTLPGSLLSSGAGARAVMFSEGCLKFVWPLSSTILKRVFLSARGWSWRASRYHWDFYKLSYLYTQVLVGWERPGLSYILRLGFHRFVTKVKEAILQGHSRTPAPLPRSKT